MTARLSGWQRLWIVLSGLYLILVAGLAVLFWPEATTTFHRDEFVARMPAELRANVDGAYSSKWAWEEAWKARVIPSDKATTKAPQRDKRISQALPDGFVLETAPDSFSQRGGA